MIVLLFVIEVILVALLVFYHKQLRALMQQVKVLTQKNKALESSKKNLYKNLRSLKHHPDLDSAKSISLDYLRVRMTDKQFREHVVNQIKGRLQRDFLPKLRSDIDTTPAGLPRKSRLVDGVIDVKYKPNTANHNIVLFRIKLRVYKHPEIIASLICKQVAYVIVNFLNPDRRDLLTEANLFGFASHIQWDDTSKPTPTLTMYQDSKANITFKSTNQYW